MTLPVWVTSMQRLPGRTPMRPRRPLKLAVEQLEDRTVPSNMIDLGGTISLPIPGVVQEGTQVAIGTTLFEFTDHGGANVSASDFTATITWGDGTSTTATSSSATGEAQIVSAGSGTDAGGPFSIFDVNATANSHVYDEVAAGTKFTVKATDTGSGQGTGPVSIKFTTNVYVTDAAISVTGVTTPGGAKEGVPFSGAVATFTDANPTPDVADYTATITWGDGGTSTATSANGGITVNHGVFTVSGSHTYANPGTTAGSFSVSVSDVGGATDAKTGTTVSVAFVNDLTVASPTVSTVEDVALTVPAANGVLKGAADSENDAITATPGTFPTSAGGSVTIAGNGGYTYTPPPGYFGSDSFHFTATTSEDTTTGTVTVLVIPAAIPGGAVNTVSPVAPVAPVLTAVTVGSSRNANLVLAVSDPLAGPDFCFIFWGDGAFQVVRLDSGGSSSVKHRYSGHARHVTIAVFAFDPQTPAFSNAVTIPYTIRGS
jgi:hypothetical protein